MRAFKVETASLGQDEIVAMFDLFGAYYDHVSFDRFLGDLRSKTWAILLQDDERIVGFTTAGRFDVEHEGARRRILYSGDTVVRREFWGDQMLAASWLREVGKLAAEEPAAPLYWLLIVKGHRTYRYLPTFGLEYIPHWGGRPAPELMALRDELARKMFGDSYDAASGVVRFPEPRGNLIARWAVPSEREKRRRDVEFFLQSNPGYADGDELVCLCSLSPDNMRPYARRLFEQGFAG